MSTQTHMTADDLVGMELRYITIVSGRVMMTIFKPIIRRPDNSIVIRDPSRSSLVLKADTPIRLLDVRENNSWPTYVID